MRGVFYSVDFPTVPNFYWFYGLEQFSVEVSHIKNAATVAIPLAVAAF